jgi:hypothetical protein
MRLFPRTHAAYLVSMHELASQAYERAQSDKARLKVIGMVLGLIESEAKLLGLDAETRNRAERPDRSHVQPTIWNEPSRTSRAD